MRKRWIKQPYDIAAAQSLEAALQIDPLLCALLAQRGIATPEEAQQFFSPALEHLHNPFLMRDMREAVKRLQQAVDRHEKILLYGDYDVDGTTSVALMYAFLSPFHSQLDYYLPDRDKEGYGLSLAGIDYAHREGCTLLIAMDCGIKAHEAVEKANGLGIDVLICDHHLPDDHLPRAVAILDPKRPDCPYPYKELSGCGIAFKLAQAYAQDNHMPASDVEHLLDLVAMSIACDIVPMTDENRILAHFGLNRLNRDPRLGLWALIQRSNRKYPLTINDLVFGIGPLINAAGRLGDARDAVRVLLANDRNNALDTANFLVQRNRQRQEADLTATTEARLKVMEQPGWEGQKSVVLFEPSWHKGIIGITASRVVETYHRPTVIMTLSEGRAVGSARSIPGFDLYGALQDCADLFYSFGGHAHAAGLQMPVENVPAFTNQFEAIARQRITPEIEMPTVEISGLMHLSQINSEFWHTLQQFAPFGPHNMNPVFMVKAVRDTGRSRILANNHVRLEVEQDGFKCGGIGFGLADAFKAVQGQPFHLAFNLVEENWQGQSILSMQVKDIKST